MLHFLSQEKTSNPSRIDYIVASNNLLNKASNIKVEIRPQAGINSDHDYLKLDI